MSTNLNRSESGVAIQGYDPVSYFTSKPALGNPTISSTYADGIYYFVSEINQAKFESNPEQYVPQYGGFCATAVSVGYKFSVDPTNYNIVDDKLYLYYRGELGDAKPNWDRDVTTRRANADTNWSSGNLSQPVDASLVN